MRKSALPLLMLICLVGAASSALADTTGITVTLTSPQTTYTAGVNNTFTFNVGLVTAGIEYVDRYLFTFPATIGIVSATPASGAGGCGSNAGVQQICAPSVSWAKTGLPCSAAFTPTGCGVYLQAASTFTVVASVPAAFTGPLTVTLYSTGDGFGSPPHTDTDTVTFQPACALTPPANIVTGTSPGICGAIVNYTVGSTGGCGVVTCTPASGSTFPLGTTTVNCASATGGQTTSFTVTVSDTQAPTLTCPATVTVFATPTEGGATGTYVAPVASDNCPGVGATSCAPPSGTFFPIGTKQITCSATDAAGLTGSCSFNMVVSSRSVLEIPTLGPAGLGALALLLASGAIVFMRRRRA